MIEICDSGKDKINGLTWHHHQDTGRMQLISDKLHNNVRHPGGMSLWYEK
ncbi:MAG: HNH endonuclease [Rickettsiaceae bacterium]